MTDWGRFFMEHKARHPLMGHPHISDPINGIALYRTIGRELDSRRIDYEAATAASDRMIFAPASSRGKHWQTLLDYASEAMRAGGRGGHSTSCDLSTREGAEAASRECKRCSGNGLVPVWHPKPDPSKRTPETVGAYCVCALGRWIERNHSRLCPDVRKQMPDLADVIAGRIAWLSDPPGTLPGFQFDPTRRGSWVKSLT